MTPFEYLSTLNLKQLHDLAPSRKRIMSPVEIKTRLYQGDVLNASYEYAYNTARNQGMNDTQCTSEAVKAAKESANLLFKLIEAQRYDRMKIAKSFGKQGRYASDLVSLLNWGILQALATDQIPEEHRAKLIALFVHDIEHPNCPIALEQSTTLSRYYCHIHPDENPDVYHDRIQEIDTLFALLKEEKNFSMSEEEIFLVQEARRKLLEEEFQQQLEQLEMEEAEETRKAEEAALLEAEQAFSQTASTEEEEEEEQVAVPSEETIAIPIETEEGVIVTLNPVPTEEIPLQYEDITPYLPELSEEQVPVTENHVAETAEQNYATAVLRITKTDYSEMLDALTLALQRVGDAQHEVALKAKDETIENLRVAIVALGIESENTKNELRKQYQDLMEEHEDTIQTLAQLRADYNLLKKELSNLQADKDSAYSIILRGFNTIKDGESFIREGMKRLRTVE